MTMTEVPTGFDTKLADRDKYYRTLLTVAYGSLSRREAKLLRKKFLLLDIALREVVKSL